MEDELALIKKQKIKTRGIKILIKEKGAEIARGYLYILKNDLHAEPFGLMEDVFVVKSRRGQGLGTKIVQSIIKEAKEQGCYKLIATSRYSRPKVHALYGQLGFVNHGSEFRIDF